MNTSSASTSKEPDKQLRNFLNLKAKVIHTDELIRRYREKGQECSSLQEQLRHAQSQETYLQQSVVGLKAEVSALMKEKKNLQDIVTASQWEKELAEARATNAELLVQQLSAQVSECTRREANVLEEKEKLAEQCCQLKEQLKTASSLNDHRILMEISPALQWRRRHHSFSSFFSLPSSPAVSSHTTENELSIEKPSELNLSVSSDSTSDGEEIEDEQDFLRSSSVSSSSPVLPRSPLVHAAADTMNSDSETDLSLSEVESLSPIPPSPHLRLPTLSPLPLSPTATILSPLPRSPELPQFVSEAPEYCLAPLPTVTVTLSPPPTAHSPELSTTASSLSSSHMLLSNQTHSPTKYHDVLSTTSQNKVHDSCQQEESDVLESVKSQEIALFGEDTDSSSPSDLIEDGEIIEHNNSITIDLNLPASFIATSSPPPIPLVSLNTSPLAPLASSDVVLFSSSAVPLVSSDIVSPVPSDTVPQVLSDTVPPVSHDTVPPVSFVAVPPDPSVTVPPVPSAMVPQVLSDTAPPASSAAVPPVSSNVVPPVPSAAVPKVPSDTVPPVSSPSVPLEVKAVNNGVERNTINYAKRTAGEPNIAPLKKMMKFSVLSEEDSEQEATGSMSSGVAVEKIENVISEGDGAVGYSVAATNMADGPETSGETTTNEILANLLATNGATGQVEVPLQTPSSSSTSSSASSSSHSVSMSVSRMEPSVLQKSLCPELSCPLALPDWLLTAMLRVQSMIVHNPRPFRKKKTMLGCRRQPKQKAFAYIGNVIERMVTGQIPLSMAIHLTSDPWNCSNALIFSRSLVTYLQTCYIPRIEHVVATYNNICSDVKSKVLDCPSSSSFPPAIIRPETQLLSLVYHAAQLNSSLTQLLTELATALSSAILSPLLNFHRLAAFARIFTGVCRLLGQKERVLFQACDLLRRPLSPNEMPVITGMIGVWPNVFARDEHVEVVREGRINLSGVEAQPLSYAVEVVVTATMKQGGLSQHHISKLHTLCRWSTGQTITTKTVDKLAFVVLQLLQTSQRVTVEMEPCQGWCRPRPSHLTFQLVHTLRLISWFKGWIWTSDVLIKAHVWPILQSWNGKRESVPEATVMAVVRLLGFIGQQGAGSSDSSLVQLQKVLLSLLIRNETPLSIQLCAAESLIDLCPPSLSTSREAVAVLWQWLRGLSSHPAGPYLSTEFCPKLSSAPPYLSSSSSSAPTTSLN